MTQFEPIEEWPETRSHPMTFDASKSVIEKLGRIRNSLNQIIAAYNLFAVKQDDFDEKLTTFMAWVDGQIASYVEGQVDPAAVERVNELLASGAFNTLLSETLFPPFEAEIVADNAAFAAALEATISSDTTDAVAAQLAAFLSTTFVGFNRVVYSDTEPVDAPNGTLWIRPNAVIPADLMPPAAPTSFTATGINDVLSLAWVNPVDSDFAGVRIVRKLGGIPANADDGVTIYTGTGTSYTATFENYAEHGYAIFAFDGAGNYSESASLMIAVTPPASFWEFTGLVSDPIPAEFAPITSGTGSVALDGAGALSIVSTGLNDTGGAVYTVPIQKGKHYKARVKITNAVNGWITTANIFGITEPRTTIPSAAIPTVGKYGVPFNPGVIGCLFVVDSFVGDGFMLDLGYKSAADFWSYATGAWTPNNYQTGTWRVLNTEYVVTLETTLTSFRVVLKAADDTTVLNATPWVLFSATANNSAEGERYLILGGSRYAESAGANMTVKFLSMQVI